MYRGCIEKRFFCLFACTGTLCLSNREPSRQVVEEGRRRSRGPEINPSILAPRYQRRSACALFPVVHSSNGDKLTFSSERRRRASTRDTSRRNLSSRITLSTKAWSRLTDVVRGYSVLCALIESWRLGGRSRLFRSRDRSTTVSC